MNSGTSTERRTRTTDTGFQAWHFFLLLSMIGATAAVVLSKNTHPMALLLLSAAVIGAGFAAIGVNKAVAGFFNQDRETTPLGVHAREALEREKALVLRSIKELEFDRDMGKVAEADAANIMTRLRARALALMEDLERMPSAPQAPPAAAPETPADATCRSCGTVNESDARFCKHCGAKMTAAQAKGRVQ